MDCLGWSSHGVAPDSNGMPHCALFASLKKCWVPLRVFSKATLIKDYLQGVDAVATTGGGRINTARTLQAYTVQGRKATFVRIFPDLHFALYSLEHTNPSCTIRLMAGCSMFAYMFACEGLWADAIARRHPFAQTFKDLPRKPSPACLLGARIDRRQPIA